MFIFFQEQNPDNDDLYISMVDDTTGRDVIIPTAFLLGKNGYVKDIVFRQVSTFLEESVCGRCFWSFRGLKSIDLYSKNY